MAATLVIQRKKSIFGCALKAKVLLDGKEIGRVGNGKSESFPIDPGPHQVAVHMGMATCRPLDIHPAEGETIKLFCGMKMGWFAVSDFELTREDGTGAGPASGPAKHHGVVVLILGIIGLYWGILGLAALGQGIVDLKKMKKGEMDPSGRTMTLVGTIIGGIGFVLNLLGLIVLLILPGN